MDEIFNQVAKLGYCHLSGTDLIGCQIENVLDQLGTILSISDVKIINSSNTLLNTSDSMKLHTDHPQVDYIVWLCLEQGYDDEYTIIVDGMPILESLNSKDIFNLQKINVHYPVKKIKDQVYSSHPLLEQGKKKIYYCPWYIPRNLPVSNASALNIFESKLEAENKIEIHLKKNEILIIDNKRVLHGRNCLDPFSPRHLRRFWIKKLEAVP